jgi:outer membrane protein OmpA-like peptidoglycan-associated protein
MGLKGAVVSDKRKHGMSLARRCVGGLIAGLMPLLPGLSAVAEPAALAAQETELRTTLAASATIVRRTDDTLVLSYPVRLGFAPDLPQLLPAFTAVLDTLARSLHHHRRTQLSVAVYTDAIGKREFNEAQSQQRAAAIAAYLAGRGVGKGRIRARGAGESEPLPAPNTPEGRDLNRRVELSISALSS